MAAEFPVRAVVDDEGIEILISQLTKVGRQAGLSEKQIKEMNDELRRTGREGSKEINSLNNQFNNLVNGGLKKAGTAIVAYFAVDRLFAFTQGVIKVTSEFQKFAAVLENTLGSRSQANIALSQITKFASQTPFSVQELTNSFVKLANQGFVPVGAEMRKLGDLAASQGKEFIMLTEAIIDAQTGEFERLKEFGIRASKQGDQVMFTFKGVKTQVDFTSEAIRNYIVGLGDAKGVSGSMAAISGTLGGQISNLEDSWDSFLNTLGQGNSGVLKDTISLLAKAIETAKELVTTDEQRFQQLISDTQRQSVETFKDFVKGYEDVNLARTAFMAHSDKQIATLNDEWKALRDVGEQQVTMMDRVKGNTQAIEQENKARADRMIAISREMEALEEGQGAVDDYIDSLEQGKDVKTVVPGLIEAIEKELKSLKELKEKATTIDDIAQLNDKIFTLTRRLNQLKNAGEDLASPFDDKVLKKFSDKIGKDTEEKVKRAHENAERMMKAFTEKYKQELKERKAAAEQHEKDVENIRKAGFNESLNVIGALHDFTSATNTAKLAQLEEAEAHELSLVGDNALAKERIKRDYDKKERALRREQAKRDRDYTLFQIAINTASAVVEALPNYVLAGIIGASGLIQAALVASKPLPAFAKGKYNIRGPGTSTSDSILSRISDGESVVSAVTTKKYGFILKPMIEGNEEEMMRNIAYHLRGNLFNGGPATDSSALLLDEMRAHRELLKNQKQLIVHIDKSGVEYEIHDGDKVTRIVNHRYRFG